MNDLPSILTQINIHLGAGNVSGAENACREGMALFPNESQLPFVLGQLLVTKGDFAAAVAVFETLMAKIGKDAQVVKWHDRAIKAMGALDTTALLPKAREINALCAEYYASNPFDAHMPMSIVRKLLPKAPIIVEAGAFDGYDTRELAMAFPAGHVYTFEPNPHLYPVAARKIDGLKNVTLSSKALSEKPGKAKLFVSSGASFGSSSLLKPKEHLEIHPNVKFENEVEVELVNLRSYLSALRVKRIDFLWLDLQGLELMVLKSIQPLLPTLKGVHLEFALTELYEGYPHFDELRDYLARHGLALTYQQYMSRLDGNALFVRG